MGLSGKLYFMVLPFYKQPNILDFDHSNIKNCFYFLKKVKLRSSFCKLKIILIKNNCFLKIMTHSYSRIALINSSMNVLIVLTKITFFMYF